MRSIIAHGAIGAVAGAAPSGSAVDVTRRQLIVQDDRMIFEASAVVLHN